MHNGSGSPEPLNAGRWSASELARRTKRVPAVAWFAPNSFGAKRLARWPPRLGRDQVSSGSVCHVPISGEVAAWWCLGARVAVRRLL
jgi:hypothetical protein